MIDPLQWSFLILESSPEDECSTRAIRFTPKPGARVPHYRKTTERKGVSIQNCFTTGYRSSNNARARLVSASTSLIYRLARSRRQPLSFLPSIFFIGILGLVRAPCISEWDQKARKFLSTPLEGAVRVRKQHGMTRYLHKSRGIIIYCNVTLQR